ncbi:MAG: bifunctional phosphopantothenoylcysteine decarboxylase/phosphopantothenate--cysteine ligase CoaBC [Alphaproteobacteria bacterium]|nr:bifunctional phosphopantothenoylcysteine decarboxylase/phosphopantothenate--cysteine ligase CoaBC [Alphaproteobacteria bacterium]
MLAGKRILLVIAGGIAAYKSLDLIRRLRERGADVRCILTAAGAEFVTPLSVQTLSRNTVFRDLFSLTDESEIGHIRLARDCDLVVVAPATADIMAKLAAGFASDLATTCLLATDRPILLAPAMNFVMWGQPATQANLATLTGRGVRIVGPASGALAEGEIGAGRMSEPLEIVAAIEAILDAGPLKDRRALVTSGPTYEPIDPVRFIGNRSSGKQGHAIAAALAALGADTTLVTGPTQVPDPPGVRVVRIETAEQMLAACRAALPADVAVCAAAVADWRPVATAGQKIKKKEGAAAPAIALTENPDILATLSKPGATRPRLVVGFAAETENVVANAQAKRTRKGCDWILANDVSTGSGTFGGDDNTIQVVDASGVEAWSRMSKDDVARRLAARIAAALA